MKVWGLIGLFQWVVFHLLSGLIGKRVCATTNVNSVFVGKFLVNAKLKVIISLNLSDERISKHHFWLLVRPFHYCLILACVNVVILFIMVWSFIQLLVAQTIWKSHLSFTFPFSIISPIYVLFFLLRFFNFKYARNHKLKLILPHKKSIHCYRRLNSFIDFRHGFFNCKFSGQWTKELMKSLQDRAQ